MIITISDDDSSIEENASLSKDYSDEDTAAEQICMANSISEVSIYQYIKV